MSNFFGFAYVEFLVLDVLGCCSPGVIYDDLFNILSIFWISCFTWGRKQVASETQYLFLNVGENGRAL